MGKSDLNLDWTVLLFQFSGTVSCVLPLLGSGYGMKHIKNLVWFLENYESTKNVVSSELTVAARQVTHLKGKEKL